MVDARVSSIEGFLSHFSKVKPIGQDQWQALCPAHSDHEPSLTIKLKDQKILIHCHTGCSPNSILQAVGLTMEDLFLNTNGRKGADHLKASREIVATYSYEDAAGKELFQVVRYQPKSFAQRHRNGSGEWTWGLKGITPILYHLPLVLKAISAGEPILITEGEKDVDNVCRLGLCATTNPMGAGKWRDSYTAFLKGTAQVVIIPDSDTPGRKHAWQVARSLYDAAIPVKVAELPDATAKDVTEWLDNGATKDDLMALIGNAPPWTPAEPAPQDAGPTKYNRTDLGNAERLVAKFGEDVRFCYERKSWVIWKGTHWQWDYGGEIMRLAQKTVRGIYEEAAREDDEEERKRLADWAKASESNNRINAMIAQAEPLAKIPLSDLDVNRWLFNVKNGTIDLRTGELRPPSRDDYITMMAPVDYHPKGKCDLWMAFLNRVCAGNKNLIGYLQRCIGYSLTGDTTEQTIFFAYGTGQNGKSTFLTAFMEIFGPYAAQADVELFLSTFKPTKAGHSEDLASMAGMRLVVASEFEEGRRLAVPKLKQMTGGERIRASHKYEREFEYEVTYKIWLNANHKPEITDTTYSIWRRVKLIPFNITIPKPEQDRRLREKLRAEYPAILAWAVQGCVDWQDSTLGEPLEVTSATDTYRLEQDILGDFMRSRCRLEPNNAECFISHKDLFSAYQEWCGENSIDSVTSRTFSKRMKDKEGVARMVSHGQLKWRYIRLLRVDEISDQNDQNEAKPGDEVDGQGLFSKSFLYKENIEKFTENGQPLSTLSTPGVPGLSTTSTQTEDQETTPAERLGMVVDGCGMFVPQLIAFWKSRQSPQIAVTDGVITDLEAYVHHGILREDHVFAIVGWVKDAQKESGKREE